MAPATTVPTLEVRRTFNASRARVFAAWTRPEEFAKWGAPGPMTVALAEMDVRVGGAFRTHMRAPDGTEHRVTGVYREVDPPKRLVYTWSWETDPEVRDSVVTVEFHERGESTEVVVRHAGLPSEAKSTSHEKGWNGCLDKLPAML